MTKKKKSDKVVPERRKPFVAQAKFLRVFEVIALLRTGKWSIEGIAQRIGVSDRTIYRYITLLEEIGFSIDKNFNDIYFIHSSDDDPTRSVFTFEELGLIRTLIETGAEHSPLKGLILEKLSLNSEVDRVPRLIVKAQLGKLVDKIAHAIRAKKQVILKGYHSAHSQEIKDRLIEPIEFGDNYQTVVALDIDDKVCKQFKLDRIGEVAEGTDLFHFEKFHVRSTTDIFGMRGSTEAFVTLRLGMRAYLLLREDYPLSIPYCQKEHDRSYRFCGPVQDFNGVGRFVLGLPGEVSVISPLEFKEFLREKLERNTFFLG